MKVSTKGRYALRMMVDLALYDTGEFISLKDVAKRQDVSMKYLEQIVSQLTKSSFLHSVRGPQGGYRLARHPSEYTAGDILRATEGNLAPVSCLAVEPNHCPRANRCETLSFWEGLNRTINDYMDSVTLYDLVTEAKQNNGSLIENLLALSI